MPPLVGACGGAERRRVQSLGTACLLIVSLPGSLPAATLRVTNASDSTNGNVSSPAALAANPGADGISLREAILAVNTAPGPHEIGFAAGLLGQTIALATPLPFLVRDGIRITGLRTASGAPGLTLDGGAFTQCCGRSHLTIAASGATIEGLRFVSITPDNRAIRILVGPTFGQPTGPQTLTGALVAGNEFDNTPRVTDAYAITIGSDGGAATAIREVTVEGNTFSHFQGDATTVHLQGHGERGVIENVTIRSNTFTECSFAVELVNVGGSGNTIRGTRIERNIFERSLEGSVTLLNQGRPDVPPASENLITGTLIGGNRFVAGARWAIQMNGGFGTGAAIRNAITQTTIVNNVITRTLRTGGGILVLGGDVGGNDNRVSGISLLHNTIVDNDSIGVTSAQNPGGAGNRVEGLEIRNTVFWQNQGDVGHEIGPQQIRYSLTAQPGFAGVNGNIAADPLLVDSASGDFRLAAISPAVDAGTSEAAVRVDANGNGRVDDPQTPNTGAGTQPFVDMGAFEHLPAGGGAPCVPVAEALCLNASRFRIEADWKTPQSGAGVGQVAPLTADTGYLWFFDPANVEAVVKVLSGCGLNQRYWVFAGGLTNVETLLTVTDTRSGSARQYLNPPGTPFQPIQDTDAFATCP